MPPDYMSKLAWYSGCASQSGQIGLISRELSYIYVSELKVAAFPCQVDDLVVPIWPYQFFNAVRSDRRSEPITLCFGSLLPAFCALFIHVLRWIQWVQCFNSQHVVCCCRIFFCRETMSSSTENILIYTKHPCISATFVLYCKYVIKEFWKKIVFFHEEVTFFDSNYVLISKWRLPE